MKIVFRSVLPIVAIFFLAACDNGETANEKRENSEGHDSAKSDQPSNAGPSSYSVSLKDGNLNAVYQHYIHLTTALTNSDAAEAKVAANAIEAGAKNMDGGSTIATEAAKITNAGDIEAQRIAYSTLSNNFIDLIKKSGLKSGELYVDYCPMAFDNKGADWLSNKKEIRNPYFGEKMMECGEVKETIQ